MYNNKYNRNIEPQNGIKEIIFDKSKYKLIQCKNWLNKNGYGNYYSYENKKGFIHFIIIKYKKTEENVQFIYGENIEAII